MEMKVIHERFKDNDSPSVEGQIHWLKKQGFAQHHIEQALIGMYSDLEHGKIPRVFSRTVEGEGGRKIIEKIYRAAGVEPPDESWGAGEEISNGHDLDQYLLQAAKQARTDELSVQIKHMEEFVSKLHDKWEKEKYPSVFAMAWRWLRGAK